MSPSAIEPQVLSTGASGPTKNTKNSEPALIHRSLVQRPYKVTNADGHFLYLDDGRQILDACGGAAVSNLGHGNQEVLKASIRQMQQVSYIHTGAYTTDSAEDLARAVIEPHGSFDHGLVKAYFAGSGSEANDAAMKCARQYWFEKGETQRRNYVARRQGYHGNTIAAMSISHNASRKIPYHDILMPNVSFVSPASIFHVGKPGETEQEFSRRLVAELEEEFLRLGPETVISFSAETMVGATSGTVTAPKGYWTGVRALCDKYGILLHLDEVMCGTGRTGSYYAFEQEGIRPDIVTVGKGLGGGYAPIAGMLINQRIVDTFLQGTSAFNHGHTYQAHPVSCAAALAVQTIIRREKLLDNVVAQGQALGSLLHAAFDGCEYVADIRGRGLFWSIEFMQDKESKVTFARDVGFGARVQSAAFDLGVAVYPGAGTVDGFNGDHVLIAPPYTITEAELSEIVQVVRKAYDETVSYYRSVQKS